MHGPRRRHAGPRGRVARYAARNPASARRAAAARRGAARAATPAASCTSTRSRWRSSAARAPYLWSLDGDRYTDLLGEFTAGLYGHSHPVILDAVRAALDRGISYGGTNDLEHRAGRAAVRALPGAGARALHQLGHRGEPDGARARAAPHRPARDPGVQGRLPRRRARVRQRGAERGHGPARVRARRLRRRRGDARADPLAATLGAILVEPMLGSGGCIPASRRVPGDAARGGDGDRRGADLRRDHDLAARPAGRRSRGSSPT